MIRPKKKTCKVCGNVTYIYGHGMCESCWRRERAKNTPYKAPGRRSHLRGTRIPPKGRKSLERTIRAPRSDKRKDEEALYKKVCAEIDDQAKETGNLECFFCGKEIKGKADHHHLKGRTGKLLCDREYIRRAHRKCHNQYHFAPVDKIPWFGDYLNRLCEEFPDVYEKELKKIWKSDKNVL